MSAAEHATREAPSEREARGVRPRPRSVPSFATLLGNAGTAAVAQRVCCEGCADCAPARGALTQAALASSYGRALEPAIARDLSSALGFDAGGVRLHDDATASKAAQSVGASAFTVGRDVYMGGRIDADSISGRRVLAHEVAHAYQQRDARPGGEIPVGPPGDRYEREADTFADAFAAGDVAAPPQNSAAQQSVQRQTPADAPAQTQAPAAQDPASGTASAPDAGAPSGAAGGTAPAAAASGTSGGYDFHLDDIALLDTPYKTPLISLPTWETSIPLLAAGAPLGPVVLAGELLANLSLTPMMALTVGPAAIRDIVVHLDPLGGVYTAHGALYVGAAVTEEAKITAGLEVAGVLAGVIGEIPFEVQAGIEGGLMATLTGSGAGSLTESVTLGYRGGSLFLNADSRLQLGALLALDLDAYLEAKVYELVICEHEWPLGHFQKENAQQFDVPLTIDLAASPKIKLGSVTTTPIRFDDIETAATRTRPKSTCKPMEAIIRELQRRGILPADVAPHSGPPAPPAPPGVVPHGPPGPTPSPAPPAPAPPAPAPPAPAPPAAPKYPKGTYDDPIKIVWYKPRSVYPQSIVLDLNRGAGGVKYGMVGPKEAPTPDNAYIGIEAMYLPSTSKKPFQLARDPDPNTPKKEAFKALLKRHDYDANAKSQDIDHVQDLDWMGADENENLWPLDASINRSAGNQQNKLQIVLFDGAPTGGMRLQAMKAAGLHTGKYFVIAEIRRP